MIKLKRTVASLLLFAMFISLSMWPVCAVADSNAENPVESAQLSAETPDEENTAPVNSEQTGNVTPSPGQTDDVTPSPAQTGNVTPNPGQTDDVTPSPAQTGNVTPSPEQTGSVTPSPQQTDVENTGGVPKAGLPVSEGLTQQDNLAATVYVSKDAYLKSAAGETLSEGDIQRGVVITLSGNMPKGASVVAYPVQKDDLPDTLDDVNVLCAYDITIYMLNGVEFEPEVGDPIAVSISAPEQLANVDEASVYHVQEKTDNEPAPEPELVAESAPVPDGKVEFEANVFSIYVIANTKTYEVGNPYMVNIGSCGASGWASVDLVRKDASSGSASTNFNKWSLRKESVIGNKNFNTSVPNSEARLVNQNSSNGIVRLSVSGSTAVDTMYLVRYNTSGSNYEYFYVKVVKIPRTTVPTIDSTGLGVTLKMLDRDSLSTFSTQLSGGGWQNGPITQNLLSKTLDPDSGYPTYTRTGASISSDIGSIITSGRSVNHLFLSSVYDSSKTFYYNSAENYAYLGTGSDFKVYNAVGTINNPDSNNFQDQVGNFLPYNDLGNTDSGVPNTYGVGTYGSNGLNAYPNFIKDYLPNNPDAATLENGCGTLYKPSNSSTDYYFGLYMNAEFAQHKDGYYNGSPMVFNFSGDDDLWVYIDGVLVLDLGGIHIAQSGSINFATGEVQWTNDGKTYQGKTYNSGSTTIYNQFNSAHAPVSGFKTLGNGNKIFSDNTRHTITVFYFERGAGESDLMLSFNLPTAPENTISVTKEVTGPGSGAFAGKDYSFRLYTSTNGSTYNVATGNYNLVQGSTVTQKPTTAEGVFALKSGETAQFGDVAAGTLYYVEELDPGDGCQVNFNGSSAIYNAATHIYRSDSGTDGYYSADTMPIVTCTNDYQNVPAKLTIYKTDNAETPVPLGNAVFALFKNTGTGDAPVWTQVGMDYATDATGCTQMITGLLHGDYKLEENAAPPGYAQLAYPIYFSVSATGALTMVTAPNGVSLSGPAEGVYTITVENNPSYRLPETGGGGTNTFTQGGTLLIFVSFAGMALLFLPLGRRKRSGVKVIDRGGGGCRPDE